MAKAERGNVSLFSLILGEGGAQEGAVWLSAITDRKGKGGLTLVNVVVLLAGWGTASGGLLRGLVGEGVHYGDVFGGEESIGRQVLRFCVGNWV